MNITGIDGVKAVVEENQPDLLVSTQQNQTHKY